MQKRYPLTLGLTLLFAVPVAVSMLATVCAFARIGARHLHEETRAALLRDAALIAEQLAPRVSAPAALAGHVARLASLSGVRVTVVDPHGVVLADSETDPATMPNHADRAEIQSILGTQHDSIREHYSNTLGSFMLYAAVPLVSEDGAHIGVCRIARRTDDIHAPMRTAFTRAAAAALAAACAAALLGAYVSRRIVAPLARMEEAARRMHGGDLSATLPASGFRECASLAEAFNFLCAALRQRIEAETRHRSRLESVLASITDGVIAVSPDQRIAFASPSAGALLGFAPAALDGHPFREVTRHPDITQIISSPIPAGEVIERELLLPINGQTRACTLHAVRFEAEGGQDGWLLIFTDVTRLRQLLSLRKDFAASVSHELRTPITALLGFVETLLDGAVDDPATAHRFLGIIHAHTLRLRALINDLLDLSRIEREGPGILRLSGQQPLRPCLLQSISDNRPAAAAKRITLDCDCPPDLLARFDATLFPQAVGNLIANAIAYSPDASAILLTARQAPSAVTVEVRDHGIGIPPADLGRIFERFYRVDKSRGRDHGGTGLGLAIVKHIIQAHGGTVTVSSELGTGSVFTLTLPT
ncbi:MAG: PAS domain-containing protein [Verrucomicrobiota bacterium]|jgi:two-component system phosphate regulon sensor histidine kinase PhoR|nr:PAS domain-containing protein [Verrucomicrobiota bacterium]